MSFRTSSIISAKIKQLVTHLCDINEEHEDYKSLYERAVSALYNHNFLTPDPRKVQNSMEGVVTKFMIHGHISIAENLRLKVNRFVSFLEDNNILQADVGWQVLSFLLHMSHNPTANVYCEKRQHAEKSLIEENFDWVSCLREGDEIFFKCNDSGSELSDWGDDEYSCTEIVEVPKKSLVARNQQNYSKATTKTRSNSQVNNCMERGIDAQNTLSKQYQNDWWLFHGEPLYEVPSSHTEAHFAKRWEEYDVRPTQKTCETVIVTEYKATLSLLWILQNPQDGFLFDKCEDKFIVRGMITVASLTKAAMTAYLQPFCNIVNALYRIEKFGKCLYELKDSEQGPPLTILCYYNVYENYLRKFRLFLVDWEKQVGKQDDMHTLYLLKCSFDEKLKELSAIYEVHTQAVGDYLTGDDTNVPPNWLIAARLLSVLYEASVKDNSYPILKDLFFKSFKPYLNITDELLTNGTLDDSKKEYIIYKNDTTDRNESVSWYHTFCEHPYVEVLLSSGIQPLPMLNLLTKYALLTGSSIELLKNLNKLKDISLNQIQRGKLYDQYIERVTKKLQQVADLTEPSDESNITVDLCDELPISGSALQERVQNSEYLFMGLIFQKYLFPYQAKDSNRKDKNSYDKLKNLLLPDCFVLSQVMNQTLEEIILEYYSVTCNLQKSTFIEKYDLRFHLSLIQSIFLMQDGDIMHQFSTHIFNAIDKGFFWISSLSLSTLLEQCIDRRYPNHSSKFSMKIDESPSSTISETTLNGLHLDYVVDWPLTIIINESNLKIYNSVFILMLKVKWALWALEQLKFSDLEPKNCRSGPAVDSNSRKINILKHLRFWLLHSVGSIHTYLMGHGLLSLELKLESDIAESENLDDLVLAHNTYVEAVYDHCLKPSRKNAIKTSILQLVTLSLKLKEVWSIGVSCISEEKLIKMKDFYCSCHCLLGKILCKYVSGCGSMQYDRSSIPLISELLEEDIKFSLPIAAWHVNQFSEMTHDLPTTLQHFLTCNIWNNDYWRPRIYKMEDILKFINGYISLCFKEEKNFSHATDITINLNLSMEEFYPGIVQEPFDNISIQFGSNNKFHRENQFLCNEEEKIFNMTTNYCIEHHITSSMELKDCSVLSTADKFICKYYYSEIESLPSTLSSTQDLLFEQPLENQLESELPEKVKLLEDTQLTSDIQQKTNVINGEVLNLINNDIKISSSIFEKKNNKLCYKAHKKRKGYILKSAGDLITNETMQNTMNSFTTSEKGYVLNQNGIYPFKNDLTDKITKHSEKISKSVTGKGFHNFRPKYKNRKCSFPELPSKILHDRKCKHSSQLHNSLVSQKINYKCPQLNCNNLLILCNREKTVPNLSPCVNKLPKIYKKQQNNFPTIDVGKDLPIRSIESSQHVDKKHRLKSFNFLSTSNNTEVSSNRKRFQKKNNYNFISKQEVTSSVSELQYHQELLQKYKNYKKCRRLSHDNHLKSTQPADKYFKHHCRFLTSVVSKESIPVCLENCNFSSTGNNSSSTNTMSRASSLEYESSKGNVSNTSELLAIPYDSELCCQYSEKQNRICHDSSPVILSNRNNFIKKSERKFKANITSSSGNRLSDLLVIETITNNKKC